MLIGIILEQHRCLEILRAKTEIAVQGAPFIRGNV
jgi:hypothetical protein